MDIHEHRTCLFMCKRDHILQTLLWRIFIYLNKKQKRFKNLFRVGILKKSNKMKGSVLPVLLRLCFIDCGFFSSASPLYVNHSHVVGHLCNSIVTLYDTVTLARRQGAEGLQMWERKKILLHCCSFWQMKSSIEYKAVCLLGLLCISCLG